MARGTGRRGTWPPPQVRARGEGHWAHGRSGHLCDVDVFLNDGTEEGAVGGGVPEQLERWYLDVTLVLAPPAHVLLLLRRSLEAQPFGEDDALLLQWHPRQHEADGVALLCEVRRAQQRVDRRAGHPRQRRRRDDVDVTAGEPQVGGGCWSQDRTAEIVVIRLPQACHRVRQAAGRGRARLDEEQGWCGR